MEKAIKDLEEMNRTAAEAAHQPIQEIIERVQNTNLTNQIFECGDDIECSNRVLSGLGDGD